MNDDNAELNDPAAWVIRAGLAGETEVDLLRGFCERAVAAGLPIRRAQIVVDTLHPVHEGRVIRWRPDQAGEVVDYGRTTEGGAAAEKWLQSPFSHLLQSGKAILRRKLETCDLEEFPILAELRQQGFTEYLACVHRFSRDSIIGDMECIYSSWTSDAPTGFSDTQAETLSRLLPSLALAVKCVALARMAGTLVETYLGRDPGRRVLKGHIVRGVPERIRAVVWFSDLEGFTRITDMAAPEAIIPLLNDYAEATISAIHEAGGDVLKLIGDGILAIFTADDLAQACRCALKAEALTRQRSAAVNTKRGGQGLPLTRPYLGLHVGEVLYGNIGSSDRLDFTVVGPAVNEASRIAAMCRSIERTVLASTTFATAALPEDRARLVSVGRYALRGVTRPQELFTLEPDP
jgi:adenylate cyclase